MSKIYNAFIAEPTFQNLHKLQSQMGIDSARIGSNSNKINEAQALNEARDVATSRVQGFLSQDKNALNSYNRGISITRDLVKPYEANAQLKQISRGLENNPSPSQLMNAIAKGTKKELYTKDGKLIPAIHSSHPLVNHLKDLNNIINIGNAAKFAMPAVIGGISGEALHPGLGGILAGGGSALTASGLNALGSKFGGPSLSGIAQNPFMQHLIGKVAKPLYYLGGRAGINALNQQGTE